ncbi:MAG: hypothetical protein AAFV62_14125 [Pseudomonadota bacterium]
MASDYMNGHRHDDPHDPRGLIREAYRIDGITEPDCRSILFDWALGLPDGTDMNAAIAALLGEYRAAHTSHPMTLVLEEGLDQRASARRVSERPRRRR